MKPSKPQQLSSDLDADAIPTIVIDTMANGITISLLDSIISIVTILFFDYKGRFYPALLKGVSMTWPGIKTYLLYE